MPQSKQPAALEPAAEDDTRPVVDLDREQVSIDDAEGTEAMAPRSGKTFSLKIRGAEYGMPRVGPLAPIILNRRQQEYQRALETRDRYLSAGVPEEEANSASGFGSAQYRMFELLTSLFSTTIPEEVLLDIQPEELGDLIGQFVPFGGAAPSASPTGPS